MIKFKVTKKDIDRAIKLQEGKKFISDKQCPLALALSRKLHKTVVVRPNFIALYCKVNKVYTRIYDVDKKLTQFVDDFDNGKPVYPATFTIKPLE